MFGFMLTAWGASAIICIFIFVGFLIWAKYQDNKMAGQGTKWRVPPPDMVRLIFMMLLVTAIFSVLPGE